MGCMLVIGGIAGVAVYRHECYKGRRATRSDTRLICRTTVMKILAIVLFALICPVGTLQAWS
jgi:hypothetical protein